MDKQNERELLEEIYRDSYDRRAADIMAAETYSDALAYKQVRNDAFILGIRHAIHLVLPDNEASRLLYLIACVEDYGNDDADEGAPRNVKDAIVRAYASDVEASEIPF